MSDFEPINTIGESWGYEDFKGYILQAYEGGELIRYDEAPKSVELSEPIADKEKELINISLEDEEKRERGTFLVVKNGKLLISRKIAVGSSNEINIYDLFRHDLGSVMSIHTHASEDKPPSMYDLQLILRGVHLADMVSAKSKSYLIMRTLDTPVSSGREIAEFIGSEGRAYDERLKQLLDEDPYFQEQSANLSKKMQELGVDIDELPEYAQVYEAILAKDIEEQNKNIARVCRDKGILLYTSEDRAEWRLDNKVTPPSQAQ